MAKVERQQFIQDLRGGQIRLEDAKGDAQLKGVNVGRADLNGDGVVRGDAEAEALFKALDAVDRDGKRDTIESGATPAGRAHRTLVGLIRPVPTFDNPGRPIVTSEFPTLNDLKKELDITYRDGEVEVGHSKEGLSETNTLSDDLIGEAELKSAKKASADWGLRDMVGFAWENPRLAWHRTALQNTEKLSYVAKNNSGSALGRISEAMFDNIDDKPRATPYRGPGGKKLTQHDAIKNMMLHVFGQAVLTTLYGESAADLAGDLHERDQPSLITGQIGKGEEAQALDNYADMVNNEYGQELGKELNRRLGVGGSTRWTPEKTAEYLNQVQHYFSQTHGWSFRDFQPNDPRVEKFTNLLNEVQHGD
ncbi:MAG: hypothetical protein AAFU79_00915 [Myxococcota bacterium]